MIYDVKFPDMAPFWWCNVHKVEPFEVIVHHFSSLEPPTEMNAFSLD